MEITVQQYRQLFRHLRAERERLRSQAIAAGSRAAKISGVRSFLKVAQELGLVDKSPRDFLIRPNVAITSYGRYLQLDELRALTAAARELGPVHYATVVTLAGTGMRVSELAKAEWRDLYRDPAGRLGLRIRHGKGGKERVVKVLDPVFAALVALHGSDRMDASDRSPLIPRSNGAPWGVWSLWRKVKEASQKAALAKPCSPHWLRHTAATLSAAGGASAYEIQWSLGHAKLETSARYVHAALGLEKTMLDSLPAFT